MICKYYYSYFACYECWDICEYSFVLCSVLYVQDGHYYGTLYTLAGNSLFGFSDWTKEWKMLFTAMLIGYGCYIIWDECWKYWFNCLYFIFVVNGPYFISRVCWLMYTWWIWSAGAITLCYKNIIPSVTHCINGYRKFKMPWSLFFSLDYLNDINNMYKLLT